jgi:hypothetical protein
VRKGSTNLPNGEPTRELPLRAAILGLAIVDEWLIYDNAGDSQVLLDIGGRS